MSLFPSKQLAGSERGRRDEDRPCSEAGIERVTHTARYTSASTTGFLLRLTRGRRNAGSAPRRSSSPTGAMVSAVLKLYFIGTALTVLAVLYHIVDSFGGRMHVQDQNYILDLNHQTHRELPARYQQRRLSARKGIGS